MDIRSSWPGRRRRSRAVTAVVSLMFIALPPAASAQSRDNQLMKRTASTGALGRQDLRSPDARDAAEGRGTFNSPQVVILRAAPQPRPAPSPGIDWGDAGIGAGGLLGFSLIALAGTLFLAHRRRAAADARPAAGM
jgi:hypothetical protein